MDISKYKGITKNSKEVKKGYIYFCFEGTNNSGYDYIDEAIANGATKIVGQRDLNIPIYEQVKNVNETMIEYAKQIYKNPQDKLKLVGITGTDGKTSTALLIYQIINKLSSSSYVGTNGFHINGEEIEYTDFTTPFADKIYKYLDDATKKESEHLVMEVSSHALDQNRLGDIKFDVCIFTNLAKEHLDYHATMEEYFEAKKKLFQKVSRTGKIIINIDDKYGKILYEETIKDKVISVSLEDQKADIYVYKVQLEANYTKFNLVYNNKEYIINSPLIAKFNVYNLAETIACLISLDFDIESIISCLSDVYIPGRLEIIKNKPGLNIIIDFAHTAESIDKVMTFINEVKKEGKIHVLTGSAGGRDKSKRAKMGENAAKYTDFLYLTEDDPRGESVLKINEDLKKGIANIKCTVIEELVRKDAIKRMIANATSGDILVLLGKGSMKYMYYDGYKEEYEEKIEVLKALKE